MEIHKTRRLETSAREIIPKTKGEIQKQVRKERQKIKGIAFGADVQMVGNCENLREKLSDK